MLRAYEITITGTWYDDFCGPEVTYVECVECEPSRIEDELCYWEMVYVERGMYDAIAEVFDEYELD